METKELGKISDVKFGLGGYQDANLGIQFWLELGSGGSVCSFNGYWDPNMITSYGKWTEEDRDEGFAKTMRYISDILKECKVDDISKLKGKPVEITLDGSCLKSFRILTEVL